MREKKFNVDGCDMCVNLNTGEMDIKATWGNDKINLNEPLQIIRHVLKQLMAHRRNGNNTRAIQRDIAGYRMILAAGVPDNAVQFMRLKELSRAGKLPKFADNIEVVELLRKQGLWKEKQ